MLNAKTVVDLGAPAIGVAALVWAAVSDLRRYVIPNLTSAILLLGYVAVAIFAGIPFAIGGLAVALPVFGIGTGLFATNRMGAGDVKLLTVLALWAGPRLLGDFAIVTFLAASILSAFMLSPLGALMPAASSSALGITGSNVGVRRPLPFGVAIAAGGFYLMACFLAHPQ